MVEEWYPDWIERFPVEIDNTPSADDRVRVVRAVRDEVLYEVLYVIHFNKRTRQVCHSLEEAELVLACHGYQLVRNSAVRLSNGFFVSKDVRWLVEKMS